MIIRLDSDITQMRDFMGVTHSRSSCSVIMGGPQCRANVVLVGVGGGGGGEVGVVGVITDCCNKIFLLPGYLLDDPVFYISEYFECFRYCHLSIYHLNVYRNVPSTSCSMEVVLCSGGLFCSHAVIPLCQHLSHRPQIPGCVYVFAVEVGKVGGVLMGIFVSVDFVIFVSVRFDEEKFIVTQGCCDVVY